ncbi:xaa-Pro aminopeptidase 3 isoform X2 [Harmonia axyridis]|uniref:xaa-Pro aminopeptidase 3 isoform X2 n=1 Tax=Harmonia axyridis TaxID=115357 RepID=UPI001E277E04|nr:xaa-Pro aminopeptidase 3 isoform X2 [Harmonia axyridis]
MLKKLPVLISSKYSKNFIKVFKFSSYSRQPEQSFSSAQKCIGQPTHYTHPHLLKSNEITPMITTKEYQNRRAKLIENINQFNTIKNQGKHFMVVIPSASKKYMSDKIPYVFRQNTEFLYLTGCQEPDSCLVLINNDSDQFTSVLFVQGKDAHTELWDGPRVCPSTVNEFFGVDQGFPMKELENYLQRNSKSKKELQLWYDVMSPVQENVHNVMENILKQKKNFMDSPKTFIDQLRLIKSPAEIELMKKSCQIASEAIITTIKSSFPGINEHEINAKVDYECRLRGAQYLAYPPVVAGGRRANIIHYITNNQIVTDKEMVLMDAGCEYHGYSSDITRTWPIEGRFTKEQRELYDVVLETQKEIIGLCKNLPPLDSLFDSMCKILGKKLQEIGLIPKSLTGTSLFKAAYKFCPHHVSHYLGMDVHDTPSITRNIPIRPGMIVTVEPGIYVQDNNESVPKEYRGIGIRIEDDVLITADGPEVLTDCCPKEVDDILKISSKTH